MKRYCLGLVLLALIVLRTVGMITGQETNLIAAWGGFEAVTVPSITESVQSNARITQEEKHSGQCSLLLRKGENFWSLPVDVKETTIYRLDFFAKAEGEGEVLINDIHYLPDSPGTRIDHGYPFKPLKITGHGDGWTKYTQVFYTPRGTATIKIRFLTRQNKVYLDDLSLTHVHDEHTKTNWAINGDFELGETNYCGWHYVCKAHLDSHRKHSGEYALLFEEKGWVIGDPIYYEPGQYKISYWGLPLSESTHVGLSVQIYDKDGSKMGVRITQPKDSVKSMSPKEWCQQEWTFMASPEGAYIKITGGGSGWIDDVVLKKVAE